MWKHAAAASVEPPLLQTARLRLRSRELVWLNRFAETKPASPLRIENTGVLLESKKLQQVDNLAAARLRIHKSFQEFKAKCPEITTESQSTISTPKEEGRKVQTYHNCLEMARQRIRRRFEDKVLAFLGFPSTLKTALDAMTKNPSSWGGSKAIIITSPRTKNGHHRILCVNHAWEELCGYTQGEVAGKSLGVLGNFQAPTDPVALAMLTKSISEGKKTALTLKNSTKDGRIFENYLRVVPLYNQTTEHVYPCQTNASKIVAYLGVLEEVNDVAEGERRVTLAA